MLFRCIKSDGLAHHSYFVADGAEAVVIDPRRDVDVYLDLARQGGFQIRWILETHRNEDCASGATALAAAAGPGAEIVHSGHLDFAYGSDVADGDSFDVGRLHFRVLETPGHTPESLTFSVSDTSSGEGAVMAFTGDALFVGDTGRVDLLGPEHAAHMAGMLYDSLVHKILPLGDGVLVYPAHGSGSVCGGAISDRDVSSIGLERLHNPGFNAGGLQEFVRRKLAEQHLVPPYFRRMEEWNQQGNAPIHERLPVPPALSPGEIAERVAQGAVIVDARMPQAFAGGHIPGSYSVWRDGLAAYLGWVVAPERSLVLVLPEDAAIEGVMRTLLRIGFDHVDGYLRGGFESWQNQGHEVERHGTIDTADLASMLRRDEDVLIVDVRTPAECEQGTIEGACSVFVGELEKRLDEIARDRPVVTMCSVGHRGALAASILARHGFREVYNYLGGYQAWCASAAGRPRMGLVPQPPLRLHSVAQLASRRR